MQAKEVLFKNRIWIGIVVVCGTSILNMWSQQSKVSDPAPKASQAPDWIIAAGSKREFEVASVKPSAPNAPITSSQMLSPYDESSQPKGEFRANSELFLFVAYAYKIKDVEQLNDLTKHLPGWAREEHFTIIARPEENATRDQVRLMLQSLLEDRFKLTYHYENESKTVFGLELLKPGQLGPTIHPHPSNQPCVDRAAVPATATPASTHGTICGFDSWQKDGHIHFRFTDVNVSEAAPFIGMVVAFDEGGKHSLVDQTKLEGKYDIDLEFTKSQAPSASPTAEDSDTGISITSALRNQLGMKLVKRQDTVWAFVVDHVERPSQN